MTIFLVIIHTLVCLFLIAVVLLQSGKGAEIGAAFGGSSQTIFGSRGAASFLSKLTTVSAIVFMITSLLLAVVTNKGGSVVKKVPVTQEQKSMPIPSPTRGEAQPVQQPQQLPSKPQQQPQTQQQSVPQASQKTPAK
jgi:preprotein translocase subunit SecG